eukprot:g16190.t1
MPASKFVVIRGLVKKPELNGKYGSVVGGIDDGRYPVQVRDPQSNDLKTFKVKSENTTAVTFAELCKGLPHPVEIFTAQLAASSLQTFKPRLTAIHDRLESLPQDEGRFRDVKDLALCVELGLAKFASLSPAGFPAARVEELRDYFCRRVAEVTLEAETGYLNGDHVLVEGKRSAHRHECCYHVCYTCAIDYLIEYHHKKNGAFEKVVALCEQWITYENHRAAGMAGRSTLSERTTFQRFGVTEAVALMQLEKHEHASRKWELLRLMANEDEAIVLKWAPAPGTDKLLRGMAEQRAMVELNLAHARLAANKITIAEHKKALDEIKTYCPKNTQPYRNILRCLFNNHDQKPDPAESDQTCPDTHCAICLESLAEGVAVLPCVFLGENFDMSELGDADALRVRVLWGMVPRVASVEGLVVAGPRRGPI